MQNEYSNWEMYEIFNDSVWNIEMKHHFNGVKTIEDAESLVKKGYCLAALHASTPSLKHYEITEADFKDLKKEKSWDVQWNETLRIYQERFVNFITRD